MPGEDLDRGYITSGSAIVYCNTAWPFQICFLWVCCSKVYLRWEGLVSFSRFLWLQCFLGRTSNYQSHCRKHNCLGGALVTSAWWHNAFCHTQICYQFTNMQTVNYEFLYEAQGISWKSPEPLLSSGFWEWDYETFQLVQSRHVKVWSLTPCNH